MGFTLRSEQVDILTYTGGRMGIIAVPGSGKTFTLSLLTAELIERGTINEDQEILVVTLVNSAVDNFHKRVSEFLKQRKLLSNLGYRVRTLHGLAHDIVLERPELASLDNNFSIIDEREAENIIQSAAIAWIKANPGILDTFFKHDLQEYQLSQIHQKHLPLLIKDMARSFIRYAKDNHLSPDYLKKRLDEIEIPLDLVKLGVDIYADYQRSLSYRGAVDFDDLISKALTVLLSDEYLLERLRSRWPYILEDEAQDSNRLQEEILSLLVGGNGNWVRVGDPNQAIYETFTTANPKFLRSFINKKNVKKGSLPVSGRSSPSIVKIANYLVEWTQTSHPTEEVRDGLQGPPYITLTPLDDPQPNPSDNPLSIKFITTKYNPGQEIHAVAGSIDKWLKDHKDSTVAVLVPRNQRAFDLADELKKRGIDYTDNLLRSTKTTRSSAGSLGNILRYLSDPQSPRKLASVYKVYHRAELLDKENAQWVNQTVDLIRKCKYVENFLWPTPGNDWLEETELKVNDEFIYKDLLEFREVVRRWQASILLPVDQIILNLAQDLLHDPAELAIAHKLAVLLRNSHTIHPDWRLPEFTEELSVIANNERRFLGFADDDIGFDPDRYKGKVVISTIHKAKGLEWDRVYLMSVNNYDFPSGMEGDSYISEKWFIRDNLNLEAEIIAQLETIQTIEEHNWYIEGNASLSARLDYVRERLRLLYVGITRAKKDLIITYNSGRRGEVFPSAAFVALNQFWENIAG